MRKSGKDGEIYFPSRTQRGMNGMDFMRVSQIKDEEGCLFSGSKTQKKVGEIGGGRIGGDA